MTDCPKCAAPLRNGVCDHCGWSPPSRGALVRFADSLPQAIALPAPARQLTPGIDFPVDQGQRRDYIQLGLIAGMLVTLGAVVLIGINVVYRVYDLIEDEPANFDLLGLCLNASAGVFWFVVSRCLVAIWDWAQHLNREYESFVQRYQELLQDARTKRYFPNDETFTRLARNHPDAILAREQEFLGRSDELSAELSGRFFNFVSAQADSEAILAYVTEHRRAVQAAYFYKSLTSPADLARAKGEEQQITENAKARLGTLGEIDLQAEATRKLEQNYGQKETQY